MQLLHKDVAAQACALRGAPRNCSIGSVACAMPSAPLLQQQLRPAAARPQVAVGGLARDVLTAQQEHIEGDPLAFLDVTEQYWQALRNSKHEPHRRGPTVVTVAPDFTPPLEHVDFDVVVCGGTLGLMVAATLQRRGHKVAVVDKRLIQGRTQEWNISEGELQALADVGLLTRAELASCIVSRFNPVRVGFAGGEDLWVNDCLNLGVSPRKLLDLIKAKFVEAGGALFENHSFRSAEVVEGSGVKLTLVVHGAGAAGAQLGPGDVNRPNGLGGNSSNLVGPFTPFSDEGGNGLTPSPTRQTRRRMQLNTRLLLDCMGHYSDIVKQMRGRAKPDGMCLVVGSCAEGFPTGNNTFGDLLYTLDDARDDLQMFWEAFPAEGGKARTTYMFAYSDAEPQRPNFEVLLDRYFESLEKYQGVPAQDLRFKRVLFGGFPCWSDGPLQPRWSHIMQIGDASATQSPLSFGGFGAMLRHLPRLTEGLDDALRCGALSADELKWMHPYQPSLAASWLFQRSMSVGVGQLALPEAQQQQQQRQGPRPWVQLPAGHVNEVLACNFSVMKVLGDWCLRPFLQDTIKLVPLSLSMAGMMLANPVAISRVLLQVGPKTLFGWFGHYFMLVIYTALHTASTPVRSAVRGAAQGSQNRPEAPPVLDVQGREHRERLRHSTADGRSRSGFALRRALDAWEYGSGSDHTYHPPDADAQVVAPSSTRFTPPSSSPPRLGAGDAPAMPAAVPVAVADGAARR